MRCRCGLKRNEALPRIHCEASIPFATTLNEVVNAVGCVHAVVSLLLHFAEWFVVSRSLLMSGAHHVVHPHIHGQHVLEARMCDSESMWNTYSVAASRRNAHLVEHVVLAVHCLSIVTQSFRGVTAFRKSVVDLVRKGAVHFTFT